MLPGMRTGTSPYITTLVLKKKNSLNNKGQGCGVDSPCVHALCPWVSELWFRAALARPGLALSQLVEKVWRRKQNLSDLYSPAALDGTDDSALKTCSAASFCLPWSSQVDHL